MAIEYVKGDLFSDTTSILLHACNCRRTWGSGVAATFANKFPKAYEIYRSYKADVGDIRVIKGDEQTIICLFTSDGYGKETDPPELIAKHTATALWLLGMYYKGHEKVMIASPKINAGLFRVPWSVSEELIEDFLEANPNFNWKVYYVEDLR